MIQSNEKSLFTRYYGVTPIAPVVIMQLTAKAERLHFDGQFPRWVGNQRHYIII